MGDRKKRRLSLIARVMGRLCAARGAAVKAGPCLAWCALVNAIFKRIRHNQAQFLRRARAVHVHRDERFCPSRRSWPWAGASPAPVCRWRLAPGRASPSDLGTQAAGRVSRRAFRRQRRPRRGGIRAFGAGGRDPCPRHPHRRRLRPFGLPDGERELRADGRRCLVQGARPRELWDLRTCRSAGECDGCFAVRASATRLRDHLPRVSSSRQSRSAAIAGDALARTGLSA